MNKFYYAEKHTTIDANGEQKTTSIEFHDYTEYMKYKEDKKSFLHDTAMKAKDNVLSLFNNVKNYVSELTFEKVENDLESFVNKVTKEVNEFKSKHNLSEMFQDLQKKELFVKVESNLKELKELLTQKKLTENKVVLEAINSQLKEK
jgi:hypothetical protein